MSCAKLSLMEDALSELGQRVALQLQAELAGRTFGACDAVTFAEASAREAEGETHYQLSWQVSTVGGESTVTAVVLPDFLELEPELLISQLVALLAERVLSDQRS